MARIVNIDSSITEMEFNLAKLKFVKSKFPKVKFQIHKKGNYLFSDKSVNSLFTEYTFTTYTNSIYLNVYYDLEFDYNGRVEFIKINSTPNKQLCLDKARFYINNRFSHEEIKFYPLKFKSKNKEIKTKLRSELDLISLKFIKDHPGVKINKENMSPRIEKLLLFS